MPRAIVCALIGLAALLQPRPVEAAGGAPMLLAQGDQAGATDGAVPEALLSGDLSAEERSALLARLSDSEVRELLLRHLDVAEQARVRQETGGMADFIGGFEAAASRIHERYRTMLSAADGIPALPAVVLGRLTEGKGGAHLLIILFGFGVIVAAGWLAERLFRRFTRGYRAQVAARGAAGTPAPVGQMLARLLMDLLGVAVFGLVALGVFLILYQGHEPTRFTILTYLWAVVLVRAFALASRFLLAPSMPALRIVPLSDADAQLLHRWVVWLAIVGAFGLLTGSLLQLLGIDPRLHDLYMSSAGIVFLVMLLVAIWRGRRPVAGVIRGDTASASAAGRLREIFAASWHVLATGYVLVIWALAEVQSLLWGESTAGAGIGSLLVVVAIPLADAAIRRTLADLFAAGQGEGPSETSEEPASGYLAAVVRGTRVLLVLAGLAVVARLWGIDVLALSSGGLGAEVARALLHVGFTILLAYVGWMLAKTAIDRRLALEGGGDLTGPGDEGGGHGAASRLKTLLPLFRRFLFVTIVVMAVMIVLSSLGVQIGPLLAGAGVVGIAIGFGAQTLVRDIVSGVFFLLDDAFRMGEYVDVGVAKGTVERITVRSLVLRHHRGPLNIIPFGEIGNLTNFSRDWVIMKLQFRVTYDTDVNKVKKIFKKIGAELMADETLGPGFIEPLKSQGVYAMEDSAMIVRAKFMAKPGEQFTIRKEVYRRIQQAFKENGIEFAHRQVTVHVPGVSDQAEPGEAPAEGQAKLSGEQAKAVKDAAAAAALAALAEEEAEAKGETAA